MFRKQISSLELIAKMYNSISATILPVESDLLQQQLSIVDACVKKGVEVWPYALQLLVAALEVHCAWCTFNLLHQVGDAER